MQTKFVKEPESRVSGGRSGYAGARSNRLQFRPNRKQVPIAHGTRLSAKTEARDLSTVSKNPVIAGDFIVLRWYRLTGRQWRGIPVSAAVSRH